MKRTGFLTGLRLGLLTALCLFLLTLSVSADAYRTLQTGMSGQDVVELKLRMYELGYIESDRISDEYDDWMAAQIAQLQSVNGLAETGIAAPELQEFVYTDACLTASGIELVVTPAPSLQPAATVSPYRTLEEGDAGSDVLELKRRMFWLGYFSNYDNLSESYNAVMAERVSWFQRLNGLSETGVATPELQALIYSEGAVKTDSAPTPSPTPAPTLAPRPIIGPQLYPEMPALTEKGFLPPDSGDPFVFISEGDGHWIYISADIFVEIKRYTDSNMTLVWYETEIKVQNGEKLTSYLTAKTGKAYRFSTPEALAEENSVVVAITDDFFGHRLYNNQTPGIIIRNGEIISSKTYKTADVWPPLDTMAVFADGSMKTFGKNEHTAQEYLDMGAEQVFAFGPILVRDGQMGERIQDTTYYHYREPRCALGMIEPGHYLAITVNGRVDSSRGAYLPWVAERMLSLGVTEALNLDGGGTTSLIFLGEQINAGGTGSSVRSVTSIIGFGTYGGDEE